MGRQAWPVVIVLAVLACWAGLVDTGLIEHRAVAGPVATAIALWRSLADGSMLPDLGYTALRVVLGVLVGLGLGIPVGLFSGTSAARKAATEPGLDFLRAIPPLLVFPILLLAFGYDERARVGAVAWATVLVVSLHVSAGASRARPERVRALRAMGVSRWQMLRWLHLYEVLPGCLTAVRHAVATGLIVAVVTEMIVGAPHGLGTRAVNAQVAYDAPGLYAVIVATGLCGYLASRLLMALERRLVTWQG